MVTRIIHQYLQLIENLDKHSMWGFVHVVYVSNYTTEECIAMDALEAQWLKVFGPCGVRVPGTYSPDYSCRWITWHHYDLPARCFYFNDADAAQANEIIIEHKLMHGA